jgi:hypothetical protein
MVRGGIKQRLGLRSRSRSRTGRKAAEEPSSVPTGSTGASASSSSRVAGVQLGGEEENLRAVVAELFLTGTLNAKQSQRLAKGGVHSKAEGVGDLAAAGHEGRNRNISRDMMRKLLKGCPLPPLYWAKVPVWVEGKQVEEELPFLLPHESIAALPSEVHQQALTITDMPELQALVDSTCQAFGVEALAPIGLHGDGVPISKGKSLEIISWNFASQPLWERTVFAGLQKMALPVWLLGAP